MDALSERAAGAAAGETPAFADAALQTFTDAVNDDLNLPEAFAALFALIRESNSALRDAAFTPASAAAVLAVFDRMDSVLGVIRFGRVKPSDDLPPEVAELVAARAEARKNKQWAESDRLRDELAAMGWEVRDSKEGQKLKRLKD